jgi:hypothetical protein
MDMVVHYKILTLGQSTEDRDERLISVCCGYGSFPRFIPTNGGNAVKTGGIIIQQNSKILIIRHYSLKRLSPRESEILPFLPTPDNPYMLSGLSNCCSHSLHNSRQSYHFSKFSGETVTKTNCSAKMDWVLIG